jgi:hypothetical protein
MRPPRKRPISVTITAVGVLLLGAINVWRVVGLIRQLDMLLTLEMTFDPRLQLVVAIGWAILFGVLTIMTWRHRPITKWLVPFALTLYAIFQLLIPLIFAPAAQLNSAEISFYITIVLFSAWALNRPATQTYFQSNP